MAEYYTFPGIDTQKTHEEARERSKSDFYRKGVPGIVHEHKKSEPCEGRKHATYIEGEDVLSADSLEPSETGVEPV